MKINILHILAAACVLALSACSRRAAEKPVLMVSVEPQRAVLERLVGDEFEVVSLLGRGSDPENFEPSMGERLRADAAEVYFATGVLPFEERLRESSGTRFADTSQGIEFIYGTHSHAGEEHGHDDDAHAHSGAPDPHYWTSARGAKVIAANMAAVLAKLHPEMADSLCVRLARTEAHYDSLDAALARRLASVRSRSFAVWHPSLSYFARDYGMHQLVLGAEGKELSARALGEAISRARADSVAVFFYQEAVDSRQAGAMSAGIGSRLVRINPMAYDWEGQLILAADALAGT